METRIRSLLERGVIIPFPQSVCVAGDVVPERIEPGVVLQPGVLIEGGRTLLGRGSVLGPGGHFENVRCGRDVRLADGHYHDCVFLDGAQVRSGAEIRSGSLFMERAQAAHTVGCKMTVLAGKVTLGSLVNFCDVFVSGGTDRPFDFTEIGSGAVHYNFTPNGLKFGSLIGPGAPGEMFGLFPRTFIGGQTQIVAPVMIGSGVIIPAGTSIRSSVPDGVICIEPPLKPGQHPYQPARMNRVREKFSITATILAHYQALKRYFEEIRGAFACRNGDFFMADLYREAVAMLNLNIEERMSWLFFRHEEGERADFFCKLPQSLEIHRREIACGRAPTEAREHEVLLERQEALRRTLARAATTPTEPLFLENWRAAFLSSSQKDYWPLSQGLSPELKQTGRQWLYEMVAEKAREVERSLAAAGTAVEIVNPYRHKWDRLYSHDKIIVTGDFEGQDLGVLNQCGARDPFDLVSGIDMEMVKNHFERLLDAILLIPYPLLIKWPDLWNWLGKSVTPGNVGAQMDPTQIVRRSCIRFHGTDGLRGRMIYPEEEISLQDAIRKLVLQHEVTPSLFASLSRNTVYARQFFKKPLDAVAIARDTRDLYAGDPQRAGTFYQAVRDGVLSTGVRVYDLGVMPIAGVAYFMAHGHAPDLAIYKTASHNPPSQDGIKLFLESEGGACLKADPALETAISALLVKEATGGPVLRTPGELELASQKACAIFARAAENYLSSDMQNKSAFVVADLAHGAFADPNYREIIVASLEKVGEKVALVGNAPNGRNINNNEGHDRVGAAHLENVQEISRSDTLPGGRFCGFPAVEAVFSFVENHPQQSRMAWAIFTDGDGDRGQAAFYHPRDRCLKVIDGEKAFFYQVARSVITGKLGPGEILAFTVESSVPFVNALISCVEKVCPVHLDLGRGKPATGQICLKITPVGDKYLLAQQCAGTESSGHIIDSFVLDKDRPAVWAGNGLLAMVDTVRAFDFLLQSGLPGMKGFAGKEFDERLQALTAPYPRPFNTVVYIYFVDRSRWYRDNELWRTLEELLRTDCGDYSLTGVDFPEEPDTLYSVAFSGRSLDFAILARLSGTENKMGIKLYGTSKTSDFFARLAEKIYFTIAPVIKDPKLGTCRDQRHILSAIADRGTVSVEDVGRLIGTGEGALHRAYSMMLVHSLAEESLAEYDGNTLKISERGKRFLQL